MQSHHADGSLAGPRFPLGAPGPERLGLRDLMASFEKSLIVAALLASGGNQRRAALALGVLPTTLQEKLKRFGLQERAFGRRGRRAPHPSASNQPDAPHQEDEAGPNRKEEREK